VALLLVVLGALLNAPRLAGPLTDGQSGNCGAMFALFERNEKALGLLATHGVPVLNLVPPTGAQTVDYYAHHPPGLPWLVMLAGRLPMAIELASRLVALALFLAATLLLADLAARLASPGAALAAGLLMLALPAGRFEATLVNYEVVALPALLLLLRVQLLGVGPPRTAAALAALTDWIALLPLLAGPRAAGRRTWLSMLGVAAVVVVGTMLLARTVSSAATGDTLPQALRTTFLAPDFSAAAWISGLHAHMAAFYGWALLPALLSLLALPRQPAPRRRALLWLLGIGLFNVVVFARHATDHEHFSLPLLPWVALSIATLLFPGEPARGPSRGVALGVLVAVLGVSTWWAQVGMPSRTQTTQSELAAALRAGAPQEAVYVRPAGASFVFLYGAGRQVAPLPAGSLQQARDAVATMRQRFHLPESWPGWLAIAPGESVPAWAVPLGAPQAAGAWRLLRL
jgi:hypothetical protein